LYGQKEISKNSLTKGDLLFNRTNSRELVGKTTLFDLDEQFTFAGYLVKLVPNKELCNPYFLNIFMNLPPIKKKIRSIAKGSIGQANISPPQIKQLSIFVPPIKLQNQFEKIIREINSSIISLEIKLKKLQDFDNSLKFNIFEDVN